MNMNIHKHGSFNSHDETSRDGVKYTATLVIHIVHVPSASWYLVAGTRIALI